MQECPNGFTLFCFCVVCKFVGYCMHVCLRGYCVLLPSSENISLALTVLRYSERPVEGAAWIATTLRLFNRDTQQMGTFIVLRTVCECHVHVYGFQKEGTVLK